MASLQERIAARLAQSGRNMHESKGGETLAAGTAFGRLVGVVETGLQHDTFEGNPKETPKIILYIELSGSLWTEVDGKLPIRTIDFTNKDNSKGNLMKTLRKIDPDEKVKHIAELIGRVFYVEVYHVQNKKKETRAYIRNLEPAVLKDPNRGSISTEGDAAPQIAKSMFFLWDNPTLEDWDDLFIGGAYDDGESRNTIQNEIRAAIDFEGSPIHELLAAEGDPLEDIDPETGNPVPGSIERNKRSISKKIDFKLKRRSEDDSDSGSSSASQGASRRRR